MKVAWSEKKVNERIDEGQGQLMEGFIAKSRQKAEERGREKSSPTSAAAAAAAAARGFTAANTVERCSVVLRRQRPNANNFFSEILNVMHVRQLCVCISCSSRQDRPVLYIGVCDTHVLQSRNYHYCTISWKYTHNRALPFFRCWLYEAVNC
jgi:hypothetical protein